MDELAAIEDILASWDSESAEAVRQALKHQDEAHSSSLVKWLRYHKNDADAVIACMMIVPPPKVSILRRLSFQGSQKQVFECIWELTQHRIVLKQIRGTAERVKTLMDRELLSHPFSHSHKNIIQTNVMSNNKGDHFLVEPMIEVLNDKWSASGLEDEVTLLHDISSALAYLDNHRLVHADVKPDNVGKYEGGYLLLDFGVCRQANEFQGSDSVTGSLRTRAPESLLGSGPNHKSDIWALGATVFNSIVGRYPLFESNDPPPPRPTNHIPRKEFEETLIRRAQEQWGTFVVQGKIDSLLWRVLEPMLSFDPKNRPDANQVIKILNENLRSFVRNSQEDSFLSPTREIDQLVHFLPQDNFCSQLSRDHLIAVQKEIAKFLRMVGLDEKDMQKLRTLANRAGIEAELGDGL